MIRRPPRSTRTDTLFPTRRSSDLAPGRRRLRSRRARRRDRGVRGMTSLLRTIFVVARRDFLAIVATPTFLLFLLAPLFMIGMGAIGGFGASQLADSARGAGRIVIRSEEHTSELQSLMRISYAVFCLKKKPDKQQ